MREKVLTEEGTPREGTRPSATSPTLVGFEALERWVVGEFRRVMMTRASGKRTRALRELSLRAGQVLRQRERVLTAE